MAVRDTILIVLAPLALTLGSIVGSFRFGLAWRDDLGLKKPTARDAMIYSAIFVALLALFEFLYARAGGDGAPGDWRARYHGAALVVRVLFAAVIYPLAEELFFRGFLLAVLKRRAGVIVAVVATSVAFTSFHSLGDTWLGAVQIFTDGMLFAVTRARTGSLYLPMVFHVAGNSLAVAQRVIG